jgi:DNA polymerase IV
MERCVLHLDLSDFPVAVERIIDPTLRDRPVLISQPDPRARVFWASSEAREWKAERGMFLNEALKRCRAARVVPPNERLYVKVRENVLQIVGRYSPVVEPSEIGRSFVDLTGTHRLFGPMRDTAQRIHTEIRREIGLPSHLGLSTNKSTSEVASGVGETSLVDVFPGSEETFLAPQPALYLPGVEEIDAGLIEELNIRRVRQFAEMSPSRLALVFGKIGPILHMRAKGYDPRPVRPPEKKPAISEERELPVDTNNRDELLHHIFGLIERGAFRLRTQSRSAGSIELTICYSDNVQVSGVARVDPPSQLDAFLFDAARGLFRRILQRRVRVSYAAISLSDFTPARRQMALFPKSDLVLKEESLTHALDDLRTRLGTNIIRRGGPPCPALPI